MATNSEITKAKIRLYTEIAAVALVLIAGLGNISITTDLATDPEARPDPFTGSEFRQFRSGEFLELQRQVRDCQEWREEHVRWGRQRAGRNDEVHRNLEESLRSLQSQVLYLYQQHEKD